MSTATGRTRPPRWRRIAAHPVTHLVTAFVVLAIVQALFVRLYQVPSGSMEPTLAPGDRILTSRVAYIGSHPTTGDVVVFQKPLVWAAPPQHNPLRAAIGWIGEVIGIGPSNQETLTKRVVAGPGQTVSCCSPDGRLLVDQHPMDEPYVGNNLPFVAGELDCSTVPASTRCLPPITVPANGYFVLGDNRADSSDSATLCRGPTATSDCARFVPADDVVGKVIGVVWPLSRWLTPLRAS